MASQFDTLETFDNPHPDRDYQITHIAPEFTSMCPKTGHPDFGTITLRYSPGARCVELKSYKLYLHSYRNVGAFYEDVTNRILNDLVKLMDPVWLELTADWTPRGGLRSVIVTRHGDVPGVS